MNHAPAPFLSATERKRLKIFAFLLRRFFTALQRVAYSNMKSREIHFLWLRLIVRKRV